LNTGSPAQGAGSTATRSRRARDTDVTVGFDMNSDVSQAIVAIGHFARRQGGTQEDSENPSIYQRLQSIESSLGSLVGRVDRIESLTVIEAAQILFKRGWWTGKALGYLVRRQAVPDIGEYHSHEEVGWTRCHSYFLL